MPDPRESTPAGGVEKTARPVKTRTRRVLLVDPSPALKPALTKCRPEQGSVVVVHAKTLKQARKLVKDAGRIDLVVACDTLSDGSGLTLVRELKERDPAIAAVLLTDHADFALAQEALRLGATDLIVRGEASEIDAGWLADATARVGEALDRQWTERIRSARIRKLKRLCKKLNAARLEVSEQVDVLCSDLVTAYQELAVQVQSVTHTHGYIEAIGDELDLEVVLRKTLEYIVKQAGPCNAAVFLPSSADEFALGGYVNYDCTKESADMLLEHLADVLAPRVAGPDAGLLHVTDNQALDDLLGDDWNYLADCHLLALPAAHDDEALAVITLFRDSDQPFTEPAIEALSCISEQMGELLGRIIRVHHRAIPGFNDSFGTEPTDSITPSQGFLPPSQWNGLDDDDETDDEEDDGLAY